MYNVNKLLDIFGSKLKPQKFYACTYFPNPTSTYARLNQAVYKILTQFQFIKYLLHKDNLLFLRPLWSADRRVYLILTTHNVERNMFVISDVERDMSDTRFCWDSFKLDSDRDFFMGLSWKIDNCDKFRELIVYLAFFA